MGTKKRIAKSGWIQRKLRSNDKCYLCGNPMSILNATRDHVIPVSKGGSLRAHNIRLAHSHCNRKKADKLIRWPIFDKTAIGYKN